MAEAFKQLTTGRIRPVAIEAPWDIFGLKADVELLAPSAPPPPPTADPDAIAAAAKLIATAKRPLISVGGGAIHAAEAVMELARLLQAPGRHRGSGRDRL